MMQALRENTKPIFIVTIAAFVGLIFLAWGADFQLGCGDQRIPSAIALVNGQPIPIRSYQDHYQILYQQQVRGRQVPSDITRVRLLNQAYNQLVEDMLLRQAAERRDLGTNLEEVLNYLRTSPPPEVVQNPMFHTDGRFDISKYYEAMRNREFLARFVNFFSQQLPVTKLLNELSWGATASAPEAKELQASRSQQATISYLRMSPLSYGRDPSGFGQDELEAYYQEHLADYTIQDEAVLAYGKVLRVPSALDTVEVNEIMETVFLELEAGEEFDALLEAHSEADAAMRGGPTGSFLRLDSPDVSPPLLAVLDSLKVGEYSRPYSDRMGHHIVRLDSTRKENDGTTSYRLKDILVRVRPTGTTVDALQERIFRFRDILLKGQPIETAAESTGVEIGVTDPINLTVKRPYLPDLPVYPEVLAFIREAKPGEISPIFEAPNGYYVWRLESRGPGIPPALSEIEQRVRTDLSRASGEAPARRSAEEAMSRIRQGETLESIAQSDSLVYLATGRSFSRYLSVPGIGYEPEIIGTVFAMDSGGVEGPFEAEDKNLYIVRLDERDPEPDVDASAFKRNVIQMKQDEIATNFLEELKEKGSIKDYRNFRTGTY